eukprot:CAMPEP_0196182966 /NCGR_PEP_ID=MMETSP0911-20130528/30697_1 /TAXON_ID=49265 /ORGANISM="Thalassiosira rotula, Strain GSO102" /LENGTH=97 /DNA_ID=CAMNT_0041452793 /DNA_START=524 /DNA_END=817 /DNA_ORIENTATION=-
MAANLAAFFCNFPASISSRYAASDSCAHATAMLFERVLFLLGDDDDDDDDDDEVEVDLKREEEEEEVVLLGVDDGASSSAAVKFIDEELIKEVESAF